MAKEITGAPLVETRATATETTTEAEAAKITVETTTVTMAEVATNAIIAIEITMITEVVVQAVLTTNKEGSLSSARTISEMELE